MHTCASAASAQSSEYCAKVRARAAGRASLLIAPRVFGDVLRFPSSAELGPSTANNYQLRFGLSFSPLDLYRGLSLNGLTEADCHAHDAARNVERVLAAGEDAYALPALSAQLQYLEQHRTEWQALIERAGERLEARLITSFEFGNFARSVNALERKLEQLRGEAEQLRARGAGAAELREPARVEAEYLASAREYERRDSSQRSLDAWELDLHGGVIPSQHAPEWFGWLRLSYSLGGPFSSHQESKYLTARSAELTRANYEVSGRIRELERSLRARRDQAQRELELLDRQLTFLARTRTTLDTADAAVGAHARDALVIEQIETESERLYLHVLIQTLSDVRAGEHG